MLVLKLPVTVPYTLHKKCLKARGDSLEGKKCAVSGAGNVAIYCCEKLYQVGATPVTVSDSRGAIYDPNGIKVDVLKQVKEVERCFINPLCRTRSDCQVRCSCRLPGRLALCLDCSVRCCIPLRNSERS